MSQDEREASDPAVPSSGFGSLTVDEIRRSLDTELGRGLDPSEAAARLARA